MRFSLARCAGALTVATAALTLCASASAQSSYPDKPIRILVGQAPGGGTDFVARLVAKQMTESLGRSIIIDNRTGAAGSIAAGVVAQSPPDGYTLLLVSSSFAIDPNVMKLSFDPIKDFEPVSLLAQVPFLLVADPRLPVKNVKDLLALAQQRNGALTYGSGGPDSSGHLAGVLLSDLSHQPMTHVPYRGAGPALSDVMAGHVQFMFASVLSSTPLVRQGSLRALAISGDKRSPADPSLPTVAESGVPGYAASSWYALFAPKGTPPDILDKLSAAADKAIKAPDVRDKILPDGGVPLGGNRAVLKSFLAAQMTMFHGLVQKASLSK